MPEQDDIDRDIPARAFAFRIEAIDAAHADALETLHTAAFGQPGEGQLVRKLLESGEGGLVSLGALGALGAVADGDLLGHILFSPVSLEGSPQPVCGLAPMAVLPPWQRQGIGGALIKAGLEACRAAGYGGVVVLGHPDYYPRFGFQRADIWGIRCQYPAPPEAFMALPLVEGGLGREGGLALYHPLFDTV